MPEKRDEALRSQKIEGAPYERIEFPESKHYSPLHQSVDGCAWRSGISHHLTGRCAALSDGQGPDIGDSLHFLKPSIRVGRARAHTLVS